MRHSPWTLTILALLACLISCNTNKQQERSLDIDAALEQCDLQVHRALSQLSVNGPIDTTAMPRNIAQGDSCWTCRPLCAEEWCSGFWPGILWLDYEARLLQGRPVDSLLRTAALDATQAMHRVIDRPVLDHDLGFLVFCSAGTAMRVLSRELEHTELTSDQRDEDEAAIAVFRQLCLRAADSLATLFRPTVGTILSWPRNVSKFGGHNTIMDNMINLEMLCWAAKEVSSDEAKSKQLRGIAVSHAETTRQHHFRPNSTCYHVAVYDTLDGHFIHGVTHQGLADSSTWARGQAWAVYGFTMMARETKRMRNGGSELPQSSDGEADALFLETACRAADAFISRLPNDYVPFWDFDDPRIATSPSDHPEAASATIAPRDASAAAVVASALIELSSLVTDAKGLCVTSPDGHGSLSDFYLATAKRILASLASDHYQGAPDNCAFLKHSTGHLPAGSEIDIPIIYADYYYLEALNRLKALQQ